MPRRKLPQPNRVAVYLTAAAGLLTALAPAVANLDLSSTAGLVAGLLAIVAVVSKWLDGWHKHEDRITGTPDVTVAVDTQTPAAAPPADDVADDEPGDDDGLAGLAATRPEVIPTDEGDGGA